MNANNKYKKDLIDEAVKVDKIIKFNRFIGMGLCTISAVTLLGATFGNGDNYLPMSTGCFNPEEVNIKYDPRYPDKQFPRYCSPSKMRSFVTPLWNYWKDRDIQFSTKTYLVKNHQSNIKSTSFFASFASGLSLASLISFGYSNFLKKEQKNLLYRLKQVKIYNNENTAIGAIAYHKAEIDRDFAPQMSEEGYLLQSKQFELELTKTEKLITDEQLLITENRSKINQVKLGLKVADTLKQNLPEFPGVTWFNWEWFRDKSQEEEIPHIRVVASTGVGKSTLIDWLMRTYIKGESEVISPKADKNPLLFKDFEFTGVPDKWADIRAKFEEMRDLRVERNRLISEGVDDFDIKNYFFDEWRYTLSGMGKFQSVIAGCEEGSADDNKARKLGEGWTKNNMKDTLTLARAARIRLILTSLTKYLGAWGLAGETDLVDCMLTVYLGTHALDEATRYIDSRKQLTEKQKEDLQTFCESQGKRLAFISSNFGEFLGVVPEIKAVKVEDKTKAEK